MKWKILLGSGAIVLTGCTTCREEAAPVEDAGAPRNVIREKVVEAPDLPPRREGLPPPPRTKRMPTTPDPEDGDFTVEEALEGMPGDGPVQAVIHADLGRITCKLYTDKAPRTAANFIGLARGTRPFWDARQQRWVKRPFYQGSSFHRVIPEYMIQGGCPYGDGSGGPGYDFADEHWEGETHGKRGLLCMANRGPDTNGSQFFILDEPKAALDRHETYTIFGECTPPDIVARIARVPQRGAPSNRPLTLVRINRIAVERQNGSDRPPEEANESGSRGSDPRRPGPNDYIPPGALLPPREMPPPEKRRPRGLP